MFPSVCDRAQSGNRRYESGLAWFGFRSAAAFQLPRRIPPHTKGRAADNRRPPARYGLYHSQESATAAKQLVLDIVILIEPEPPARRSRAKELR